MHIHNRPNPVHTLQGKMIHNEAFERESRKHSLCRDYKGPLYSLLAPRNNAFKKILLVLLVNHKQLKEYNVKLGHIILSLIHLMYTKFEAFSHLCKKLINQHIVKNELKAKLLKSMKYIQ